MNPHAFIFFGFRSLVLCLVGLWVSNVGWASPSEKAPVKTASAETPAPAPKSPEAQMLLNEAVKAQLSREYEKAEDLFTKALKVDPTLVGVQYQRAMVAYNMGDEKKATTLAYDSIGRNEAMAASYNLIGTMAARKNNYSLADWAYQKGVEAAPADAMLFYNWSEVLRNQGKPLPAIEKLRAAIQRNPGDPLYPLKLRLARIEAGEAGNLRPDVERELQLVPPSADWVMTAAAVLLKEGKTDDAAKMLNIARQNMQPILFFGLLQEDPFFRKYKKNPKIAPFYDVSLSVKKAPDESPVSPTPKP